MAIMHNWRVNIHVMYIHVYIIKGHHTDALHFKWYNHKAHCKCLKFSQSMPDGISAVSFVPGYTAEL